MKTDDEKAIRLLTEQLKELEMVRGMNYKDPQFKAWRDTTKGYLERFLPPSSPHLSTFRSLSFLSNVISTAPWGSPPRPPGYVSRADQEYFRTACGTAEATIKAVLKYLEEFGVHADQVPAKTPSKARRSEPHGGWQQNFHGPVTIHTQAIATDSAIQKIGHAGNTMGADLKTIADLLQQSQDLTPRQVKEGLAGIEVLASETQKPRPDFQSVIERGQAVLAIADKATDLVHKITPHTQTIVALVQTAKRALGLG